MRPKMEADTALEINPSLLHLIRDCWSDRPEERPKIEVVRSLLKSMHSGRAGNLMDHVFGSKYSFNAFQL